MKKKSVLVVDDEKSIRISLKRMIEKENYQVETAINGDTALKILEKNHYDVVITDIMMLGISGIKLLQKIKEKYSNVAILLMTGFASVDTAIEALRSKASDYIIKPCTKKQILFGIKNAIKKDKPYKNKKTNLDANSNLKVLSGKKPLTKRELFVYECLLCGLKGAEMATKLNVTLPTIKFHLKNIYSKLGIKGRREIVKVVQNN
jgi:DNA-binding NarL/FixJ family response regulator